MKGGLWFFILLSFTCLEGLGRKYIPAIPAVAFYFAKDIVLLIGYFQLRPPQYIGRVASALYGGFRPAWMAGFAWTLLEIVNPNHDSVTLAVIGMRAYWLWWIAPLVIAGVLQDAKEKRRAIYLLSFLSIGISVLAMIQFVSPPTAEVNLYGFVDGEAMYADTAMVGSTGRARVASTFSYISGFSDFTILVPALLLSLGLGTNELKVRRAALAGAFFVAAALPMSGSRGAVVAGVGILLIIAWSAGLFFTVVGRRILIGALVGGLVGVAAFPEAFQGVQDRFSSAEETTGRFLEILQVLPPVTMATADYPPVGVGTGMQQNARVSMHLPALQYNAENENQRYLIELGPLGFCFVWLAKFGLVIALLKARKILNKAGRRAAGGTALAYAFVTFLGNLTFDHVWQSLYFIGLGFILAEVVSTLRAQNELQLEQAPAP